jgi:hypothetical protein
MESRIFFALALVFTVLSLHKCKPVDLGTTDTVATDTTKTRNETAAYSCTGKTTCSAMTSCGEAQYYLQHCPFSNMDGDGDGIPCEDQWCGH